jgi:hypothetical protein
MAKKTSGTTGGANSTRPQSEPTTKKSVGRAISQTRLKPSALLDSHYVKVMLDQIFGENNFKTKNIWQRTQTV